MRVAVTMEQCWHRVPGGTAVSTIQQAAAVADVDGVELVGVSARHRDEPPAPWRPPIPVRQLPLPRLALYESWHWLRRPSVGSATGPVDAIHATGFAIPPRGPGLLVTMHDLAVLHDTSHFTRRGVSFLRRSIELARRHADLVLCPSQATVDDCVAHGFSPERLRLIPWGVEQRRAGSDEVASVVERHRLPERYVLSVATQEPRKNLARLLAAFGTLADRGHDDVVLVLVGPEGWGPDLGAQIDALGPRCRKLGFVPGDDLPALYAGASAFCYPSILEGFGLPVLEAMVQATPVVTSSGTSTEELVVDGAGVAVDPLDVGAIADALVELLDDPGRAAAVGAAGRERAAGYTWDRTAELTMAAYREVSGR
ncbi:MAG: glycosyltransferase family 4 protein [Acidimicrobiia bacterium]|nr:glycosyltransferase family 4 protein [Acidimicrobiia bacterium]